MRVSISWTHYRCRRRTMWRLSSLYSSDVKEAAAFPHDTWSSLYMCTQKHSRKDSSKTGESIHPRASLFCPVGHGLALGSTCPGVLLCSDESKPDWCPYPSPDRLVAPGPESKCRREKSDGNFTCHHQMLLCPRLPLPPTAFHPPNLLQCALCNSSCTTNTLCFEAWVTHVYSPWAASQFCHHGWHALTLSNDMHTWLFTTFMVPQGTRQTVDTWYKTHYACNDSSLLDHLF